MAMDRAYAAWLVGVALLGVLVFLKSAAEEWADREAWLRANAERRTRRAVLEAELARNQRLAGELTSSGQSTRADGPSRPVAAPQQARSQGQAAASR